jgi:hypothetical protein
VVTSGTSAHSIRRTAVVRDVLASSIKGKPNTSR